jgi:hypothetical protein
LKTFEVIIVGILIMRLFRFASTPFLRKLGIYRYYSPMLFTVPTHRVTELHLGTSWDFMLQAESPRSTMTLLAEGLLGLCGAVERGEIPKGEVIEGTVCFLNEPTLKRFGFQTRFPGPIHLLMVLANFPELSILQSIAKRSFAPVRLSRVRRVSTTPERLLAQKPVLQELLGLMKQRQVRVCS